MLKIAVDKITPRIQYVLDVVKSFRQIEIQLVELSINKEEEYYYYSANKKDSQKGLLATSLLMEDVLRKPTVVPSAFNGEKCLSLDGITDPLASIFYHLTRLEEYDYLHYDKHGRFQSKDSFVFQFGWEKLLLVERWIDAFLSDYSMQMEQELTVFKTPLTFTLTFDIDNTYAFKWKPIGRILLSYLKDVKAFDWKRIHSKTKTFLGASKDPYDTYDKIERYSKKGMLVRLFWLLGDFGKYDRNVSNTSKKHLKFIREISRKYPIGLHPSYDSNVSFPKLLKEKKCLDEAVGVGINSSRQHFLRLQFPFTYQRNIQANLKEDYTLGFGDVLGFRAGTLRSFLFFDVSKNRQEAYEIHPFAYMDGTLKEYMHLTLSESRIVIQKMIAEAKLFGGNFIAIWHNETISDWGEWKDWSQLIHYTNEQINEVND